MDVLRLVAADFAGSPEGAHRLFFEHPELLSAGVQARLRNEIGSLEAEGDALLQALTAAERTRHVLEADPSRYPQVAGPIERIAEDLRYGRIGEATALERARAQHEAATVIPYVRALALGAREALNAGNWQWAASRHDLLIAALDARPGGAEADAAGRGVLLDRILTAHLTMLDIGDPVALRQGVEIGERLVLWAEARDDTDVLGEALHRLGSLHSDPWNARRTVDRELEEAFWRTRVYDLRGLTSSSSDAMLPDERAALETAARYLRRAATVRTGARRAQTFGALGPVLARLREMGADVETDEIVGAAHEALEYGDLDAHPEQALGLLSLLKSVGEPVDLAPVERVLERSIDEWVRRIRAGPTASLVEQAVNLLADTDPERALNLVRRGRGLVELVDLEHHRIRQLIDEIALIARVHSPDHSEPGTGSIKQAVEAAQQRSEDEGWDVERAAAFLVTQATRAAGEREEAYGLALLSDARQLAPVFAAENAEALNGLDALLHMNNGTTKAQAEQWVECIVPYAIALKKYLDMGMPNRALGLLHRIADAARRGGKAAAEEAVGVLARRALELETRFGDAGTARLQSVYKVVIPELALPGRPVNSELLGIAAQLAKGLSFATALFAGGPINFGGGDDDVGHRLLEEITQLEAAMPPTSSAMSPSREDDPLVLVAYAGSPQPRGGSEQHERLANLRARYDAHVNRRLLASVGTRAPALVSPSDVRWAIGDRSVLLDVLLNRTRDGLLTATTVVYVRGDDQPRAHIAVQPEPDQLYSISGEESQLVASGFAARVTNLLRELRAPADPDIVRPVAAEMLADRLRIMSPDLLDQLAQLRAAGKDHLCVVPHGPFHYAPFHLFGPKSRPLAEDWIVTYLPAVQLLTAARGTPSAVRRRDQQIASLGMTYRESNPYELPELPRAKQEAASIAALYGTTECIDREVTEWTVRQVLGDALYVHLAAHGRIDVDGPAFQCLYLTPDKHSDGRLSAHELLGRNLRGTQVLTLSACETALGRFDYGGNLRGLPASFLLGGVSTIIGTLWPVEDAASALFFPTFYRALRDGEPRLDAFATAQRVTRERYPRYRSWGPFCYVGEWD